MKVLFDNINLESSSGPNGFAKKLFSSLSKENKITPQIIFDENDLPDIQLSFITSYFKYAPIVQRLDGIYFNSDQDFQNLNKPINMTYKTSDAVIFQSEFNKMLTEHYFGKHDNSAVIHNGTDIDLINKIEKMDHHLLDKFSDVWCCASSWRPHKRLKENIRYFLDMAPENACFIVAGENTDEPIRDQRVFYAGHLDWVALVSLFKRASHFIHLSWLDHCPNVVIDARASDCHIVCSSAGGTKEIAGKNSTILLEDSWDFAPLKLYSPPEIDFSKTTICEKESNIDITNTMKKYIGVFKSVINP